MIIIYTDKCLNCKYAQEVKQLRKFGQLNNLHVITRRTVMDSNWLQESKDRSDIEMPYVYNESTQVSIQLKGVTQEDLAKLL